MKLYTEEQMKDAIQIALVPPCNVKDILKEFTPISLPSDEDIDEKSKAIWFGGNYFKEGVKWIIDKIKNNDKKD